MRTSSVSALLHDPRCTSQISGMVFLPEMQHRLKKVDDNQLVGLLTRTLLPSERERLGNTPRRPDCVMMLDTCEPHALDHIGLWSLELQELDHSEVVSLTPVHDRRLGPGPLGSGNKIVLQLPH